MQSLLQSARVQTAQAQLLDWLRTGLAPRQLAFTLALGFAIGCIPLFGVTTAICAVLALVLKLNMPAIQAANYLALPFQFVLLVPFLKLGQWLFSTGTLTVSRAQVLAQLEAAPWQATMRFGGVFGHAMLAWLMLAGPALMLMTLLLTPVMHRVSRLAVFEAE